MDRGCFGDIDDLAVWGNHEYKTIQSLIQKTNIEIADIRIYLLKLLIPKSSYFDEDKGFHAFFFLSDLPTKY